jgi:hypothetical protein
MPVTVLTLFSTPSAASEIVVGGRVIGRSLAEIRCCRRSSQTRLRSSSCSRFQANACLTPSPFGRGVRNSKRFSGLFRGVLSVRGEGCGSMDSELSEHGCDIQG